MTRKQRLGFEDQQQQKTKSPKDEELYRITHHYTGSCRQFLTVSLLTNIFTRACEFGHLDDVFITAHSSRAHGCTWEDNNGTYLA